MRAKKKRMPPSVSDDDTDDSGVVILESGKHCFSKKSRVESIPSKSQLQAELHSERVGNANLRSTIADLKFAKEESEQVTLKFLIDMQEMRKQQVKKEQQHGVALLESLAKRYIKWNCESENGEAMARGSVAENWISVCCLQIWWTSVCCLKFDEFLYLMPNFRLLSCENQ